MIMKFEMSARRQPYCRSSQCVRHWGAARRGSARHHAEGEDVLVMVCAANQALVRNQAVFSSAAGPVIAVHLGRPAGGEATAAVRTRGGDVTGIL